MTEKYTIDNAKNDTLSIYSLTTENYQYLVRYFDVDKKYLGNNGSLWTLDGTKEYIKASMGVNFDDVKYIRLVYKSKDGSTIEINTISGTLEVESDGIYKTLIMSDY